MNKVKQLLSNIYYTISSNLISLIISVVVTFFLPKRLGVQEYAYYQLYLFYLPYIGFLHLGWSDGVYLRYGGEEYEHLDKERFKGQFNAYVFFHLVITLAFLFVSTFIPISDPNRRLINLSVILNIMIVNARVFLQSILLMTNRMKEYSHIILLDRVSYGFLVAFLLLFGVDNFIWYVLLDIIIKVISFILSMKACKEITYSSKVRAKYEFSEIYKNIASGINALLAYIAGLFIIGVVRYGIQKQWDIETFGKVSLTLSISGFLMIFVSAISSAIFPLLKRTNENQYNETYSMLKSLLMPFIFVAMLSYFPLALILNLWLPDYRESLKYMAITFPIIVFEGKVNLLANTYLKALRRERDIFKINVVSAFVSIIFTFMAIYLLENLLLAIFGIVLLLGFRSIYSEMTLSKHMEIAIYRDIVLECVLVLLFIYIGWSYSYLAGFSIYAFLVVLYLIMNRKSIQKSAKFVMSKIR